MFEYFCQETRQKKEVWEVEKGIRQEPGFCTQSMKDKAAQSVEINSTARRIGPGGQKVHFEIGRN